MRRIKELTVAEVVALTIKRVRNMTTKQRVQTLVDAGIITEDGRLTEGYRSDDIPEDFKQGMRDIEAGRVVDLDTALTSPPPSKGNERK